MALFGHANERNVLGACALGTSCSTFERLATNFYFIERQGIARIDANRYAVLSIDSDGLVARFIVDLTDPISMTNYTQIDNRPINGTGTRWTSAMSSVTGATISTRPVGPESSDPLGLKLEVICDPAIAPP